MSAAVRPDRLHQQYQPDIQPIYAGYVIWRGVAEERDIPATARRAVFDKLAFYLPPHNKVIGYPIAGPDNDLRPGYRRFNWVWYRQLPASRLHDMLRGDDGVHYEVSIPPPQVRQDLIDELRQAATEFLPRAFSDILACIKRPFFTPIYDYTTPQMVFGRVALIGDAAALARPHIGMGVSKAASDALVLSECLADPATPVEVALARFNDKRLPVGEKTVRRGRDLGAYMLPRRAKISPSAARSAAMSARSQGRKSGRAPHLRRANSASVAPVSRCWSRNATLAPFSAKARTKDAPMPLAPPVMITVRPSSDPYRVKLIGSPRLLKSTKRDDLGCLWRLGAATSRPSIA